MNNAQLVDGFAARTAQVAQQAVASHQGLVAPPTRPPLSTAPRTAAPDAPTRSPYTDLFEGLLARPVEATTSAPVALGQAGGDGAPDTGTQEGTFGNFANAFASMAAVVGMPSVPGMLGLLGAIATNAPSLSLKGVLGHIGVFGDDAPPDGTPAPAQPGPISENALDSEGNPTAPNGTPAPAAPAPDSVTAIDAFGNPQSDPNPDGDEGPGEPDGGSGGEGPDGGADNGSSGTGVGGHGEGNGGHH